MKKLIFSTAIAAAVGLSAAAQAVSITSLSIADWDGDFIGGGFAFASGTSAANKYTHFFNSTSDIYTTNIGILTTSGNGITGGEQSIATAGNDNSFSAGFVIADWDFLPSTLTASGIGMETVPGNGITFGAVNEGDTSINYTDFNWSAKFARVAMFPMSPDSGFSTNILMQGGTCSAAIGSNTACYITRWEHFIQPQGGMQGDSVWQIEGIATFDSSVNLNAIPVPAAAWLFGSGLLGMIGVARRRRNRYL